MITYKIYSYDSDTINNSIIALYKKVLKVDFAKKFNWWYRSNPFGHSIGILAIEDNDKIIGHWAVSPLPFQIMGQQSVELISLAAMIDEDYQGKGIFKSLSAILLKCLENNTKYHFVFGFPNENSLHVHINRMNYKPVRDYSFVVIKKNYPACTEKEYKLTTIENFISSQYQHSYGNNLITLYRSPEYLRWRFNNNIQYNIYTDSKEQFYICTKFKNKIDILFWNLLTENQSTSLAQFANYLYKTHPDITKVSTWDTINLPDEIIEQKEERKYHLTVRILHDENAITKDLLNPDKWLFFMGDSELF